MGKKFCSTRCKSLYHNPPHGLLEHDCRVCQERFEDHNPNSRYCSNACRRKMGKKAPAEHARRRAAERIKRMRPRILARWGRRCYLCGGDITIGFASAHPGAMTLDHVIPISQGGRDTEDNLRPAHRGCNVDKGERYPSWWERQQAGMASL